MNRRKWLQMLPPLALIPAFLIKSMGKSDKLAGMEQVEEVKGVGSADFEAGGTEDWYLSGFSTTEATYTYGEMPLYRRHLTQNRRTS